MAGGDRLERLVLVPAGSLLYPGDRVELRAVGACAGGWHLVRTVALDPWGMTPRPMEEAWARAGLRPLWCGLEPCGAPGKEDA